MPWSEELEQNRQRFTTQLGQNIRRVREQRGFTQATLAERLPFTQASLSNYETGKRLLSLVDTLALATALECRLEELLTDGTVS